MMRRLDRRGASAFEFCLVGAAFFILIFAIFDLALYAITMQSLRALVSAGARATMIKCYTPNVTDASTGTTPSSCTAIDTYFPTADRPAAAPWLYPGGVADSSLTLGTLVEGSTLSITASMTYTPVIPVWGTALDAPSANTKIPF
jgi:hypothetical protein